MSDDKILSPYQLIQAAKKTAGRAPADSPDKNRLVDLMVFDLMVAVFTSALENGEAVIDEKDLQGVQATMEKIARRYMPVAEVNYDAYLAPFSEMPGGQRLNMAYARVNRSPMPLDRAVARGIFCAQALRFMRTKPETLKTFARKATPVLRDLMQVATEENPFAAAMMLSEQPTISGAGAIRRWVIEAAELMLDNVGTRAEGAPDYLKSDEEFDAAVLTGDVASAQNMAENIRNLERKKDLTDPMSEQAQELAEELLEAQEELKEITDNSKDKTLVQTAISTTIADRDVPASLRSMGLSEDQLAVALATGQVLVNAGAGSGKSHSLVAHVMHQITENGVNPDAILLTSFTKASAQELKARLEKKGITGRSLGRTSHSIAYGIIMQYGSRALQDMLRNSGSNKPSTCADIAFKQLFMKPFQDDEYNNSRNVHDPRQTFTPFKKVSLAWADSRFAEMVNLGSVYAEGNDGARLDKGRLLLKVGEFKNARVKADQAWDIYGSGKYGEANKVAAAFYVMYEWLKTADPQYGQCLDFDDQLVTAVEILEQNPRARAATQAQYDVVLIDEAQDFSQIQSQLFSLISEKASTVMFVGDDRQAIYEWRGAAPQEFIQRAKNEDVQVLSLQINYRSGSDIVEAGEQLIKYNTDQLPKSCRAPVNRGPGNISYRHKGTSENIAGITADEIKTMIDSGEAAPDSFGVITRTNAEKAAYMWTLAFRGIPYRSNSGADIFKKPYLKAASAALLIASPNTSVSQRNDALVELHDQMRIGTPKVFKDMDSRRQSDFVDALLTDTKPYYRARAFQEKVETLRQVVRDLLQMGQDPTVDSRQIVEKVLYTPGHDEDPETGARLSIYDAMRQSAVSELVESNIDDGATQKEATDLASGSSADTQVLTELEPLFLLADMKPNASSLAEYLRKQKEVNSNKDSNEPAVQIDTCHQWKGLAAEHVYVHMAGGSWPSRFAEAVEEKMEGDPTKREGFKRNPMFEERRLAYVAITRGKETVTINAPAVDSKEMGLPLSRFVGEACIPAQGQVELSAEDVQERQGNVSGEENHFKVIMAEALYGTTQE